METRYEHTQTGYLLIAALGGGAALMAILMAIAGFKWVLLVVLVVLLVCLALGPTLTGTVDENAVRLRFGPGLIRKTILLSDVQSCEEVKNPWWYGWGIRLIPSGYMFNVSGLRAVELRLKTGRIFRIGTDDPTGLATAIRQALGEPAE